jgi:hypothetical protein
LRPRQGHTVSSTLGVSFAQSPEVTLGVTHSAFPETVACLVGTFRNRCSAGTRVVDTSAGRHSPAASRPVELSHAPRCHIDRSFLGPPRPRERCPGHRFDSTHA